MTRGTLSGGYTVGSLGFLRSQMKTSPSSAPEASQFGVSSLNSSPETWQTQHTQSAHKHKQQNTGTQASTHDTHWPGVLLQPRHHCILSLPLGAETVSIRSEHEQISSAGRAGEADPDLIMLSGFHTATEPSLRPPARRPSEKESPSTAVGRDQDRRLKRSGEGAQARSGRSGESDWKSRRKISMLADAEKDMSTAPLMVPAARYGASGASAVSAARGALLMQVISGDCADLGALRRYAGEGVTRVIVVRTGDLEAGLRKRGGRRVGWVGGSLGLKVV
jgi:hypothetical protein